MWQVKLTLSTAVRMPLSSTISTTWLTGDRSASQRRCRAQDDAEPGIAGVETAEQGHQRIDVVVGTGHEVAAAKIDPLDLGKPFGKMVFYMYERAREDIGMPLSQWQWQWKPSMWAGN